MSNWRPDNWENPYGKDQPKVRYMAIAINNPGNAYEAGAQDIINYLRQSGYRLKSAPGLLVFIPDDEVEE